MNIQGFTPAMNAPMQAQAKSASTSTTGTSGTSGSSSSGSVPDSLSPSDLQSTFLNLLVTELQNQDPTAPVDPTEMVTQMVSLNQLDQLISINQTLTSLATPPSSSTPSSDAAHSTQKAAADLATSAAGGTDPTSNSATSPPPAGLAFQGIPATTGTSNSGSLMNLYGNIGASASSSNHFTTAGGR
jgi:flagellar basal-body rod modification protein FlgD